VPVSANAYNSLWQVRNDAWSSLEESTAQLALARVRQRPVDQLTETVTSTLNLLGPIERFWAFPGPHAYQKVRSCGAGAVRTTSSSTRSSCCRASTTR
jgi:arginine decarboxylase